MPKSATVARTKRPETAVPWATDNSDHTRKLHTLADLQVLRNASGLDGQLPSDTPQKSG
jgi:hypothetical protein